MREGYKGYKRCPDLIAEALAHFGNVLADKFKAYLRNAHTVQQTMFFIQLGSPESIVLHKSASRAPDSPHVRSYWEKRKQEDGVQKN